MPTYEYQCSACEHRFEVFQSIRAKPLRKCPRCARMKLLRLIGTGGAVLFKGTGFYQTDYRSESYRKAAAAEKSNGSAKPGDSSGVARAKSEGDKPASSKSP
jgi:putative FmdB family regulatory protein